MLEKYTTNTFLHIISFQIKLSHPENFHANARGKLVCSVQFQTTALVTDHGSRLEAVNMRHWIQEVWCAASLILLLASLSVSADTDGQHDIYIVTGVHGRSLPHYWSTLLKDQVKYFDGVYQRVKTSVGDFFAKRGFRPRSVNYFIYNVTQEDINSWVLGLSSQEHLNYCDPQDCECNNGVNYTRTFEDFAEAIFKRNKTAAPNLFSDIGTNWLRAYDGTKEGQS